MLAMKEVDPGWFILVSLILLGAFLLEITTFRGKTRRILALTVGLISAAGVFLLLLTNVGASYPLRETFLQRTEMGPWVEQGMEVYFKYGCPTCHQLNGWGTPAGPDLAGVVARHGEAWVRRYLVDPDFRGVSSPMLHYSFLTEEELAKLLAFLSAVSAPAK